jgi:3alpha(or 20beta)-hydroxysteroid dehydrogenase
VNLELEGALAVVTGAASGIGAATARTLAGQGARVIAADLPGRAEASAAQLGDGVEAVALDVRDPHAWETVVEHADGAGGMDVLVNCAGIAMHSVLMDLAVEEYQAVIDVNQTGTFLGMRAAARSMARSGGGSIVNVASIAALYGLPATVAYAASKAAVLAMTRSAAHDLAPHRIRVNAVSPGIIDTAMQQIENRDPELSESIARMTQLPGRMGSPAEIAESIVFLASARSSHTTGAELLIDGGVTLGGQR